MGTVLFWVVMAITGFLLVMAGQALMDIRNAWKNGDGPEWREDEG
jgi:uncharacterized membrane protein